MTEVTDFDIGDNQLTGDLPTQIGRMSKIVTATNQWGFLWGTEHDGATIPTELGGLTGMTYGGYFLQKSKLGGTLPTQLGSMSMMNDRLLLNSNSLTSTMPTELGNLVEMSQQIRVESNFLSSSIPTGA